MKDMPQTSIPWLFIIHHNNCAPAARGPEEMVFDDISHVKVGIIIAQKLWF